MNRHVSWDNYPVPDSLPVVSLKDPALPLVSIVTPTHQQGAWLRETIESVLAQNYPNIEYWVIDGGSTDETRSLLTSYEHDPSFHWISEPNRGQADAVNKGWVRCRGSLLGWLNSGDTLLPGAVRLQVQTLRDHTEAGVVYGDARLTDGQGKTTGRFSARPFERVRLLHHPFIPQPTVLLQRHLIEMFGLLDPMLTYALDYELFLRLMWVTDFVYQRRELATCRSCHETASGSDHHKAYVNEAVAVVNRVCLHYVRNLPDRARRRILSDWYWQGAIKSVEHAAYRDMLAYGLVALRFHLLRPRMLAFGLKMLDMLLHTSNHHSLAMKQ